MNACFDGSGSTRTSVAIAISSACIEPCSKVWCLASFFSMARALSSVVKCNGNSSQASFATPYVHHKEAA